jgi:hypothetical protein
LLLANSAKPVMESPALPSLINSPPMLSFADSSSLNQTFSLENAVAVDESALDREISNLEKEISRKKLIFPPTTDPSPDKV